MLFKFCSNLSPLVSLLNRKCSFWHLSSVASVNRSCNGRKSDSASGATLEKQAHPPYAPQLENKLHAISLLFLDSYYSWSLFSLLFSSRPQRSLAFRLTPGVYLNTRKSYLYLMPVRCFHSTPWAACHAVL